ncbi:MAG: NUDIX hydrolase [Bacteroidota bacterium]
MPIRPWTTLASKTLIERWWMTLRQDRVRLPNGTVLDEYHVLHYPDWALALPITDDGQVVMVEQYRYGVERLSLEFPAGAVDPDEDIETAARRELLEETGYAASGWTYLGKGAVEPGRHTNYGHVFVATGARRIAEPHLDAAEDLAVRLVAADELPARVADGSITHSTHIAAVFWAIHAGLLSG